MIDIKRLTVDTLDRILDLSGYRCSMLEFMRTNYLNKERSPEYYDPQEEETGKISEEEMESVLGLEAGDSVHIGYVSITRIS